MGKNNLTGAWGEALAAEFLQKKRYKILATGYRCRFGEIDLIVQNKKYLAFVEQNRLRTTAAVYLAENPTKLQPRFDVIEIYAPDGVQTTNPQIHHMEDAFQ